MASKYYAIDIARYVVNYSWKINKPISNLKLQKLLYFIQGNFLRNLNKPCFDDEIEAWNYGPVVPNVYSEFKRFGSNYISEIEYYYEYDRNKIEPIRKQYEDTLFESEEERKIIEEVIEMCKNFSASYLVDLTHRQSPWKKAYRRNNNIITIELMREFFCDK